MAQGKSKGLQSKKESRHHAARTAAAPKKGKRVIPPKKAAAVKHAALHKNLSAKINKSIEQQMISAASVGTLSIMKGEAGSQSQAPSGSKSK